MIENLNNVITRIQEIKRRIDLLYSLGTSTSSFKEILQAEMGSKKGNPSEIDHIIKEYSKRYNLPQALVKAVIKAESNFNPRAISRAGAMGLMQLMPQTAKELGVKDPFDPEENIAGGTRYLRGLLDQFGNDLTLALAAYNAGPERVRSAGGIPNITETRQYIERVLRFYKEFS